MNNMPICKVCGKKYTESPYYDKCCLCSRECFKIDFWNSNLDEKAIIVNGECFHDGGNQPNETRSYLLGHSGRVFKIKFKGNNKVIETNNLWYNGIIPSERNVPDNAEFI